jgi:tRNA modification GTPase
VAATLKQMTHREDRPVEFRVALVGPPNAGKSSLFNALVRRYGRAGTSPALVSAQPGTTRDYLVARLDVGGCQFELVDTAGTQEAPDGLSTLERAFDRAAREQGHAVDLQLECMDAAAIAPLPTPADPNRWPVITKADLMDRQTLKQFSQQVQAVGVTSAETGEGFELLLRRIAEAASQTPHARGTAVAATASRCRASLMAAAECLGRARQLSAGRHAEEIVAVEVREALDKIGQVVGTVYTDDILDRIFSQFCIGK